MHINTPSAPAVRSAKAAVQSLVAVVIVLGATHAPLAADCLEQPNSQTAQDGRWRYWRDTVSHRKCWFLQQQTRSTETSTAQSTTAADGTVGLASFLVSLSGRLSAVSKALEQQDAATAATAPAPGAEPYGPKSSPAPSNERRRLALRAKRAEGPTPADQKKSGRSEPQYLDPAQREALFQQFLRWAAWQDQAESSAGQ